jgi:hypothetical protein
MNSRRKILGVPIVLWIIIAATIGTIITAAILTSIINNRPPEVTISWNQRISPNTIVGHSYNWSINIQSTKSYDAANLLVFLNCTAPLMDWRIINVTIFSVATGETRNLIDSRNGPLSGGQMFAYNSVFIPQGSTAPEIIGSWEFNPKAPLTTYTIHAELDSPSFLSNVISATTTLNS